MKLLPGDYRVDAHVLVPTDSEVAGVQPKGRAGCFQSLVALSVVWFLFCTLCYIGLVYGGLARDALPIYAVLGVAPLVLFIALYYASGSHQRVAEAAKAHAAIPSMPSLAIVLTPKSPDADIMEGGGMVERDYDKQLEAFSANG